MPLLFWLEITAYSFYLIGNSALALMVLSSGAKHTQNRYFALFTLIGAVWALSALLLRMTLWLDIGLPKFWVEMGAWSLSFMGPILLIFAVRYTQRPNRTADLGAVLALAILTFNGIYLFQHRVVLNPFLDENGLIVYQVSALGFLLSGISIIFFAWSTIVFWRARHSTGESYLAISSFILLLGFISGGVLRYFFPFPILSGAVTISVAILGYGIASRQLLNPLRQLTDELEELVEERTKELEKTASHLESANVNLEKRNIFLEVASQVAQEAIFIRDTDQLLRETTRLISDRFDFYHIGIFLLDTTKEWAVLRAANSQSGIHMLARNHRLQVGKEGIVGYVTGSGKPRIVLDVDEDADFFDNPDLPETRSEMAIPLRTLEGVIGALDVQSVEPEAFTNDDVAALQILADQIAVAISNARLFRQVQESLEAEKQAYGQWSKSTWKELLRDQPDLVFLSDNSGVSPAQDYWKPEMRESLETGEITLNADDQSTIAIPIKVRGQVIGVVDAQKPSHDEDWTSDEINIIDSLTGQLSVALESARLYTDIQDRAIQERVVGEITTRMRETLNLETVIKTAINEIYETLDLEHVTIRLAESKGDSLEVDA